MRRVQTVWPTPAQGLITHVTGAGPNGDEPKVSLESPPVSLEVVRSFLWTDPAVM